MNKVNNTTQNCFNSDKVGRYSSRGRKDVNLAGDVQSRINALILPSRPEEGIKNGVQSFWTSSPTFHNIAKVNLIFLLFLIASTNLMAQYEGMTFLKLPYSAEAYMMGNTGVSRLTDDAMAFTMNPAQLGIQSMKSSYACSYNFFDSYKNYVNTWHRGMAAYAGFSLKSITNGDIPLSFGIGYGNLFNNWISLGMNTTGRSDGYKLIQPKEKADLYSFGIGYDYGVKFSAGITYKHAVMKFANESKRNIYDVGFMVSLPVHELLMQNVKNGGFKNNGLDYTANFSLGFARTNLGSEVVKNETYNLPNNRTQTAEISIPSFMQVGLTVDFGLIYKKNDVVLQPFLVSFSYEKLEPFVEKSRDNYYQQVLLEYNNEYYAFSHYETNNAKSSLQGFRIDAGEMFSYMDNSSDGSYYPSSTENVSGWIISSRGLSKIINMFSPGISNSSLGYIINHLHIQYSIGKTSNTEWLRTYAEYEKPGERKFYSVNISWSNR